MTYESHPLHPFLPANGRILFLGSFPPPRARWSMDFFYPNWINDFWRIMGQVHCGDPQHFIVPGERRFDRERIIDFCRQRGIALYDVARRVCRVKDNASDDYLNIVESADIGSLLEMMPRCDKIVTTGGKASEEVRIQLSLASGESLPLPKIGECISLSAYGRSLRWWRMPSSSRAYPLRFERKVELYAQPFAD